MMIIYFAGDGGHLTHVVKNDGRGILNRAGPHTTSFGIREMWGCAHLAILPKRGEGNDRQGRAPPPIDRGENASAYSRVSVHCDLDGHGFSMLRVLIGDDHPLVRLAIKNLISDTFAPVEVGEAGSGAEMVAHVQNHEWDIAIMDITMPGRAGPELLEDLKHTQPSLRVLVVSMHPEDQYAVRMFKAGASGYLTKGAAATELIEAIKTILAGHRYINHIVGDILASTINQDNEKPLHENLSHREYKVMCLLASGSSLKEIAHELCVSPNTVSTYRSRILEKMNMPNNAALIHYAIQHSLISR